MQSKIYILTAVHNDLIYTKKLLKSVFDQTFKDFEVFLVDDGSTDGTANFISKNYPKVRVLKGDGNLWWTKSLNLGLKKILKIADKNDYVWIINNDCYFSKDTLASHYKFASRNRNSIVGSLILDSVTKKIWDNGVKIDWKHMRFTSGGTDALSTKGTLYPITAFKDIGLFDAKHFPHYFSDYEFSIRAKNAGYNLLKNPYIRIYNKVDRTGIEKAPQGFKLFEILNTLFSKKSKVNLLLQINIIRYVCPSKYRLRNYLLLASKLSKIVRN